MAARKGERTAAGSAEEAQTTAPASAPAASTLTSHNAQAPQHPKWKRAGDGWLLLAGRRRLGRVVRDEKHTNMWRPIRPDGQLGDMANLSWAKNSVLIAAERELEWEDRQRSAIDPSKCPERRGVFRASSSLVRQNRKGVLLTTSRGRARDHAPAQQKSHTDDLKGSKNGL